MPRDSNGNYTKPNPDVIPGFTIAAPEYNSTNDDISAELTDSLSRSGKGAMTAALDTLDINATGNVTATGAVSGATLAATGAVTGDSVAATGALTGATVTATADASTVTAAGATEARTLADRFQDLYTVKDFADLQAALTKVGVDGGGAIEIPRNTTIDVGTDTITIPSNCLLYGHGTSSRIVATGAGRLLGDDILVNSDTVGGNVNITLRDFYLFGDRGTATQEISGIFFKNCQDVSVRDMFLVDHGNGVKIESCDNAYINGCTFILVTAFKVHILVTTDVNPTKRLTITENFFLGSSFEAIDINGTLLGFVINDNQFFNNHTVDDATPGDTEVIDIGVAGGGIAGGVINGNIFDLNGAAYQGIWIKQGAKNISMAGNAFFNGKGGVGNISAAVRLSNVENITISGMNAENFNRGIYTDDASSTATLNGLQISGFNFANMAAIGIDLSANATSVRQVSISGGWIEGTGANATFGINVENVSGLKISDVEITNFTSHGVNLLSGGRHQVANCHARNNGGDGVFVKTQRAQVGLCDLLSNSGNGITVDERDAVITGNVCEGSGGDGINLASGLAREATVTSNRTTGNTGAGLNIVASTQNVLASHNILRANTGASFAGSGNAAGNSIVDRNIEI